MIRILNNFCYLSFFISLIIFLTGVVGILRPVAKEEKELEEEMEMWKKMFKFGGIATFIFIVIIL